MKCRDCTVSTEQNVVEADYLLDKYFGKVKPVITGVVFVLLLCFVVVAQVSISDVYVKKDCNITSVPYTESVIDRYDEVYYDKNDSTELVPVFKDVTKYYDVYDCTPQYIEVNEVRTESELQNYKCAKKDDVLVCDNMIDGNGDGKCDSGETCCTIKDNVNTCLNGLRKELPTKALEVAK